MSKYFFTNDEKKQQRREFAWEFRIPHRLLPPSITIENNKINKYLSYMFKSLDFFDKYSLEKSTTHFLAWKRKAHYF